MAFHVACPITCKRICFCTLGFPQKLQSEKGRNDFLEEVFRVQEFLSDPWSLRAKEGSTVQVVVPRIVKPTVSTKRTAMQKKAAAASLAAEDYARRFESGDLVDVSRESDRDLAGENQGSSTINVMCRICFYGENEGSQRAIRMLSCKICNKKYHRNCLKNWAQHRDLFHWSSWTCPSCRTCEVCRRAGDPNKLMFCKRCDGAYHCYCQHPPHKNVTPGPYLCPKHTRCHSCGSNVPGSGLSTRWFLRYTCCDACGRLFVKGNYCPVCLKVYRDSESTPMVCCDVCQRWVHCQCDSISDEKYLQFQADRNLYYKCAACRGACYQVRDLDDAVQELWRRRDKADRDQIASMRAAAGLPTQEEIFSISPYSDDEENGRIVLKNDDGHSLKFSLKGMVDISPKNTREYGKKSSNKKYGKKKAYQASLLGKTDAHQSLERQHNAQSYKFNLDDEKKDDMQSYISEGPEIFSSPVSGSPGNSKEICSINQPGILKQKLIEEIVVSNEERASRIVQSKSTISQGLEEGTGKHASKSVTKKGRKLVIHLGARNRNITKSPRSEASSCHREQDLTASNGSEDTSQQPTNDKKYIVEAHHGVARFGDTKGERLDNPNQLKGSKYRGREGNLIKLGKDMSEVSDLNPKIGRGRVTEGYGSTALEKNHVLLGNRITEGSATVVELLTEATKSGDDEVSLRKNPKGTPSIPVSDSLPKDPKPLLKLKFKNPYIESRSSQVPHSEEEKSYVKGQRSKRKRPSPLMEKAPVGEDEDRENPIKEVVDANWILKKLGKDAIGKMVEVHLPSDNSWHKGVVTDVIEGTSTLAVRLNDGRAKTVELGKQGVRFVSQKHKRSKT
ncbi:hypothetical protein HHK36_011905 [Tetracentron sinense]|uniref:Uncharacterized protein n=1 Tax=Tetracentron sinense TaxID=13715 RepID=A0A834ZA84_TETSI|nr:hypothetical protein HHK36_011905 [Tetracentron sinense]